MRMVLACLFGLSFASPSLADGIVWGSDNIPPSRVAQPATTYTLTINASSIPISPLGTPVSQVQIIGQVDIGGSWQTVEHVSDWGLVNYNSKYQFQHQFGTSAVDDYWGRPGRFLLKLFYLDAEGGLQERYDYTPSFMWYSN